MKIKLLLPWKLDPERDVEYLRFVLGDAMDSGEIDIGGIETDIFAEGRADTAITLLEFLRVIRGAEQEGCDAIVVGCHGDPGVVEGRELVSTPLLGAMQVGLCTCSMVGDKIAVMVPSKIIQRNEEYVIRGYGFENRAKVYPLPFSSAEAVSEFQVYQKTGSFGKVMDTLVEECIRTIERDDVTVITIGCGGLMWTVDFLKEKLKERGYDIPCINPVPAAIEMAKTFVKLGITHSRLLYPQHAHPYEI